MSYCPAQVVIAQGKRILLYQHYSNLKDSGNKVLNINEVLTRLSETVALIFPGGPSWVWQYLY